MTLTMRISLGAGSGRINMSGGYNENHPETTNFISKYIISFDHKVIAKQFLWYGIFFLGVGGIMALLIRWTLAYPGVPFPVLGHILFPDSAGVVPPDTYAMLFTMHGTIMIFYAI